MAQRLTPKAKAVKFGLDNGMLVNVTLVGCGDSLHNAIGIHGDSGNVIIIYEVFEIFVGGYEIATVILG